MGQHADDRLDQEADELEQLTYQQLTGEDCDEEGVDDNYNLVPFGDVASLHRDLAILEGQFLKATRPPGIFSQVLLKNPTTTKPKRSRMSSGFKLPKPGSRVAPSDDINDYSLAIFGPKSAGKTILASCFPDTLNFRFERWRANVRINQYPARKEDPALTWEGFKELAAQAMDAPEEDRPYRRFVIDSIDEAWLMCQKETCREKFGIDSPEELGGDSYLAHQACTWEWGDTWDTIRDNGIALTWLSHCKERQMPDPMRKLGTFKMLSMSCAPAAADIVRQRCDLVWFLMKYGDGNSCKRILTVRTEEASEIVTQLRGHFKSPKGDYLYQLAVPHVPADDSPELFKFIKNGWDNKLTNYDPYGDIEEPDTEDGEVSDAPKGALSLRKSAKKKSTKKTTTKKRPSLR